MTPATTRRLLGGLWVLCTLSPLPARGEPAAGKVAFDKDVKPIFRKHCVSCHNPERPRGELDLSSFAGVSAGGTSGKVAVAGKPDDSALYLLPAHLGDPVMPPGKPKISQREIDLIRDWIVGGLVEKPAVAGAAATAAIPAAAAGGLGHPDPFPRPSPVSALAVSPTDPVAAVAGIRQVLVFDLAANKLLGSVPFPEGEIHALRFSRDGKVLVAGGGVGGQSGKVVGYEVGSWKRLFAVADEPDAVLAADISPDKTRVAFGGPGRVVKVVSVPDGKQLHVFRKPTDWVLSVGFSPEGLLVAAGDRFGGLYVWEARSGKEFYALRGHAKGVTGVAWRADSDALASCSEDHTVRVWDMQTGTELAQWAAHGDGVLDVAFHPSGLLATAGRDGRVKVWDGKGALRADLGPAADAVLKVVFTPDARRVVAADWSGAVRVWPVAGGSGARLPMPVQTNTQAAAVVPVPVPAVPTRLAARQARAANGRSAADLERKRAALKAVEVAAEKLKEEAARNPKNPALAKAYLRVCEAVLAMKAEVLEAEAGDVTDPG
jgi:mono/diheme cytochrome c family protein